MITNLVKVLYLLSAPSSEQKQYLQAIGTYPSLDELALEFDDLFIAYCGKLREEKKTNDNIIKLLEEIHLLFDKMSSQKSNWDIKDIDNDNWLEIRNLSKITLNQLRTEINDG